MNLKFGQITVEGKVHLKTKDPVEMQRYWKDLPMNIQKIYVDLPKMEAPETFGVIVVHPSSWEYLELNNTDYNKSVRKQFFIAEGLWESKHLKPL